MNFFKKKQEASITTNPQVEKLKTEIINEVEYLTKLTNRYYNDPNNDWKFERLNRPYLYLGGKLEKTRDDKDLENKGNGYRDNRHFIRDPILEEMQSTERRIRTLRLKIRSLSLYDQLKIKNTIDFSIIEKAIHPTNCDCTECFYEDTGE